MAKKNLDELLGKSEAPEMPVSPYVKKMQKLATNPNKTKQYFNYLKKQLKPKKI